MNPASYAWVWAAGIITIAISVFVCYVIDNRSWEDFKRKNNCREMIQIISTENGSRVVESPARKEWLCGDGKTYWR
jgi:hypothetical protein